MIKRNIAIFAIMLSFCLGLAMPAAAHGPNDTYQVVFQVNDNDKARMNLVLNNVANVIKHFESAGKKVEIEVVTYGGGLHMLRDDTSPVKDRIESFSDSYPNVHFAACNNTMKGMEKKEGKLPPLIKQDSIKVVPSGVIQLLDRQDQGWHYLRP